MDWQKVYEFEMIVHLGVVLILIGYGLAVFFTDYVAAESTLPDRTGYLMIVLFEMITAFVGLLYGELFEH